MFLGSFVSLALAFLYFGFFYPFTFNPLIPAAAIAGLVTIIEGVSPKGLDNIAVPAVGAATFLLLTGGT
jgi:dolichol kinase